MRRKVQLWAALIAVLASLSSRADQPKPDAATWRSFWLSVNVEPAPPRDFLDARFTGRIDNLTNGMLSDATARRWVLADLRRSLGDLYASHNLRDDIANAGIFGPPGLNGTTDLIEELRDQGVDHIDAPLMASFIAAAVVPVSKEIQANNPEAGLTDYVIVLLYRRSNAGGVTIFNDGHREPITGSGDSELRWQIDTGWFVDHEVVGPLWYQQRGWTCRPDSSVVGKLCGLVKP
ncbi:MAG TPA: hypothetical protein VM146_02170 [Steroidobacteraceae bacterium]|nr:hypothetical protein [Steroidobacteraceae bacterium]